MGEHVFDYVLWDEPADVLYLAKGAPRNLGAEGGDLDSTPEGHHVGWTADGELQRLTLINARWYLERHGRVPVTLWDATVVGDADIAPVVAACPAGPTPQSAQLAPRSGLSPAPMGV